MLTDKLMVKGEIKVAFLYLTDAEKGEMDTMEAALPFSQILDIDGLSEDCSCDIRLEILSTQVQMNPAVSGNDGSFEVELRACLFASANQTQMLTPIEDAYSTSYELITQTRPVTFYGRVGSICENFSTRGSVAVSTDRIASVVDTWCDNISTSVASKEGRLTISGRALIGMLTADSNEEVSYLEAPVDFVLTRDYPNTENLIAEPEISILSVGFRVTGSEELELRLELKCCAEVNANTTATVLTQIEPNESQPKVQEDSCALTIYYAEEGEVIWEIARRYNTSEEAIRQENNLSEETVPERTMLLIPAI